MTFGQRLKQLRQEKGMTQTELGRIINMSKPNVSKLEADIIQTNNESAKILAKFFDVSTDYLLGITDDPQTKKMRVEDLPPYAAALSETDFEYIEVIKEFKPEDFTPQDLKELLAIFSRRKSK